MIKKFTLLMVAIVTMANTSFAQGFCATDLVTKQVRAQYPQEVAQYEAQLREELQTIAQRPGRSAARKTADTGIFDIPVVVHIMQDYGVENLSDTLIYNTIAMWNESLMKENADTALVIAPFKPYIGNPRIRLHLATKDPNGNPTKGITRFHSWQTASLSEFTKVGGWPQDKYINVWVVRSIGGYYSSAAAYAYLPYAAPQVPYYDGILTTYMYFNFEKTIPHEFGHVFNLKHTFNDAATVGQLCGDDEVPDTPPTKGHYSTGCTNASLYDTACALGYKWVYKDIHNVDSVVDYPDTVNAENIMDYTYCAHMFTRQQAERMRGSLRSAVGNRNNLYTPANLSATGALAVMPDLPPVADFNVTRTSIGNGLFVCANSSTIVSFKNASWNDTIASVQWTFSNGAVTPTSTSLTNVSNRFSQPGWVTVSLTANSNSGSNTITRNHALFIADDNTVRPEGYSQTFTNDADTMQWPMFNYFDNQYKWERYTGAGYDDNKCLRFHSFDSRPFPANMVGRAESDYDDVVSPAFDLTNVTGDLNLNFYTSGAYTKRADSLYHGTDYLQIVDSTTSDSLKIYINNNCSNVWREIGTIKGANLLNNPTQTTEFTPASQNQWKAQTISIPVANRTAKAFFRLRYFPANNSNNLYLDKFSVTPFPTEVSEAMSTPNVIKVFPNPTHGSCNIAFTATGNGNVSYNVKDITGRTMYQAEDTYPTNTLVQKELSRSIFGTPGIYFITVTIANKTTTQKLIVQ